MQKHIINTDRRTFFITFLFQNTNGRYIFQEAHELQYILENYDKNGIDKIREFDPIKGKFSKVSKADILKFCSWETETAIYLEKHYYFKK